MTTVGVVIIAGIYLSSKIISYIGNELTESELEKQDIIKNNIDCYDERIIQFKEEQKQDVERKNTEELSRLYHERLEFLVRLLDERIEERKTFLDEIKNTRKQVSAALNTKKGNTFLTPLRRNSLNLLLRQLIEAYEKCYSYIHYLKRYKKEICRLNKEENDIDPFSMRLPESYPYKGNIMWIDSTEFKIIKNNTYTVSVNNLFSLSIVLDDFDVFIDLEYDKIPIMITHYGVNDDWKFHASIEKGLFQVEELRNTHLGTNAIVTEYWVENGRSKGVILKYRNTLQMYLPKSNLISTNHYPLVRQELTVYPVRWDYGLSRNGVIRGPYYPVTVSQRRSDASSSLSFSCFPICFSKNDFNHFVEQLKADGLEMSDEEWLLGPADESDYKMHIGMRLMAQLGSQPLFYLRLQNRDTDGFCLSYDGMCSKEVKSFSADSIFVPFDVSITPYISGTSDSTIADSIGVRDITDVDCFIWDIYEEFRVQHRIKKEREGISYFIKWESITNQLVEYLMQGDSFELQIEWYPFERKHCIFASINNSKELDSFLQNFATKVRKTDLQTLQPQYFVKGNNNLRYEAIILEQGSKLKINGWNVESQFQQDERSVELFIQMMPYAECCQRSALQRFRSGQIVNASIQTVCLNGASAKSSPRDGVALRPFHNPRIENNEAQRMAVEKAFLEKNCYFIQGPPGTGKTTVIRELVAQVFDSNPYSNILIVSQANVAVDNALSGLIHSYRDDIVRLGNANKISSDLQSVTLTARCLEYITKLEERKNSVCPDYYDEWKEIIAPKGTSMISSTLTELIVRKYRLIGATCVGIARRSTGLERTEFDLVIVDEAGKALPAELLIPLLRARKMVLIGDHKQLPPVINPVLYDEEKIELEERDISVNQLFAYSFFERLYNEAPSDCKSMLNQQFRMPSVIGEAISNLFYNGELVNGEGTDKKAPIYSESNLVFYNFDNDKEYCEEKKEGKQLINRREAEAVYTLIKEIRNHNKECRIAVITPYRGQKREIGNYLLQHGLRYRMEGIAVDTIDAFQGSEAEVVIFCTTRATIPTQFFMDSRRINVALSRAVNELIILGKLSYFYKDYYKRKGSCLPALADYLKNNATIYNVETGQLSSDEIRPKDNLFILSINEIIIPSRFHENEVDSMLVEKKKMEYYQYGDFCEPIFVIAKSNQFVLVDGFEQFCAIQELNVQECMVCTR